jgi:hypothetical protein
VNYTCTVKLTQQFAWLDAPVIVVFTRAAREPARSDGCDLRQKRLDIPFRKEVKEDFTVLFVAC